MGGQPDRVIVALDDLVGPVVQPTEPGTCLGVVWTQFRACVLVTAHCIISNSPKKALLGHYSAQIAHLTVHSAQIAHQAAPLLK